MKKSLLSAAIVAASFITPSAQAALSSNAFLLIGPQTETCPYGLGTLPNCLAGAPIPQSNYFAMDNDGSGIHEDGERVAISGGTDGGITLGFDQTAGGQIDSVWSFFGGAGHHRSAAISVLDNGTGDGQATIDMGDWIVFYNGGPIDMSFGGNHNGVANITCGNECESRDTFTLTYSATVPATVPGFANLFYGLTLNGIIGAHLIPAPAPVPVPAAAWLFGSGLLGLIGVARRKA